jgi:hypothetical protein
VLRPSWESMSATSAEFTLPLLSRSSTLKDSRMLWRSGGGIFESASLEPVRERGAGRDAIRRGSGAAGKALLELAPSNRAAIEAVFEGRTVCGVEVDTCRVGEVGRSGAVDVPRVFNHAGGLIEALRRGVCESVGVDVGFRGEVDGVDGFTVVEGECVRGGVGRRKGDVRGLLKERGEGL